MGQLVQPKTDVFCCKMFPISWKVLKFFHVTAVKEFILHDFTVVYLCVCVCVHVSWYLELQILLLLVHVAGRNVRVFWAEPSRSHLPKETGTLLLPPQSERERDVKLS